jgi:hypothetical protein
MSKVFAVLATVLAVSGISLLSLGAQPHAHTITLSGSAGNYDAAKDDPIEIDFGYKTTFTIQNNADVDLDFVFDAGPNNRRCRVDFTPAGTTRCESQKIAVPQGQSRTLIAEAKSMEATGYSYVKFPILNRAWPRFQADILVAPVGNNPRKVDPDLELERDPNSLVVLAALLLSGLSALLAWRTRRRF